MNLRGLKSFLKHSFFFFLFLDHANLWAIDFTYETYMIKDRENLDSIGKKFLPKYKVKYGERIEEYKTDLKVWNKHISDWNKIAEGTRIYIENPYPVFVGNSDYAPNLMPNAEREKELRQYRVADFFEEATSVKKLEDGSTVEVPKKFFLGGFYTASSGAFKETISDGRGEITFKQNSPYSLGLGGGYLLGDITHSLNASFYWSSLRASNLNGDTVSNSNSLTVPAEVGYNFYYQYFLKSLDFGLYGGVDRETFTTFNTLDLLDGADLSTVENNLTYGTIGISKTFYLGDQKFLSKLSFAKSLISDSSSPRANAQFEGSRLLLFLSMRGVYNLSYHLLYKRHQFTGPTDLTIDRIGIGFGYQFY